jgi:hypothetical protein
VLCSSPFYPLLTQLTAATPSGRLEFSSLKLLKSSEAKEDEQNDDDSLCSDPLGSPLPPMFSRPSHSHSLSRAGHLVSKEPLTPSVSPPSLNDEPTLLLSKNYHQISI